MGVWWPGGGGTGGGGLWSHLLIMESLFSCTTTFVWLQETKNKNFLSTPKAMFQICSNLFDSLDLISVSCFITTIKKMHTRENESLDVCG